MRQCVKLILLLASGYAMCCPGCSILPLMPQRGNQVGHDPTASSRNHAIEQTDVNGYVRWISVA